MHKTIEKFYLNILDYAGLKYEDDIIKNKNDKLGDFTVDGKYVTLPYMENLKNPNGRVIFHLLNESYVTPETTLFNLYRKRLTTEINLKLLNLFSSIIEIVSEINITKKIKNNDLLQVFSNIPETDLSSLEALLNLAKKSKEHNNEAFLLNIYLKKNGTFKDNNYDAIGKINFIAYKDIVKAIESKEFKVYDSKFRKKDLVLFNTLFLTIFPNIDDEEYYTEYTNNKVFRYLDILLKTSYLVTKIINNVSNMILTIDEYENRRDDLVFNLNWVNLLEDVYDLKEEIRLIPNQTDVTIESNRINIESKNKSVFEKDEPKKIMTFNQQNENVQQNTVPVNPNIPRQVTPEDILRGNVNPGFVQYPVMPVQPVMQPQLPMPSWMVKEAMQQNMNIMPMQQMPMQMPMQVPMQIPMQGMMQPGYPMQQMPMQGMMQPGYPMQQMPMSTLEVNPQMFRR